MAKLTVSAPLLLAALFRDKHPSVDLCGVSLDAARQAVELDIVGPGVPECERVIAIYRVEQFDVQFQPVRG